MTALESLMGWAEWGKPALWWLPTVAVVAMTGIALLAALAQAPRRAKPRWIAAVLAVGAAAIGVAAWQQQQSYAALRDETAQLRELSSRLGELGQLLPVKPGGAPEEALSGIGAAMASLNARLAALEEQIQAFKEQARSRAIDDETAAKMADYLRPFGSRRVILSCVPDDVEAYRYANQIATVLRAAGWEAQGPEPTTIFGEAPAIGVAVFVKGGSPPDTAKILLDAFARFNIPYQSGVTPADAIPDPATVELFVGPKA
jgi:hypothetical protein